MRLYEKVGKRLCDILLSGIGILLLSPLFVLLALLVKLSSKGPALFRQRRIGKNKREFCLWKFRSMYVNTPAELPTHLLLNPDAFITPVGRFLRKSSLDELPQLFHIFSGKMSIIGPRPALWNQYELIDERDKYGANELRPGLTGLAQINGRDELPIDRKARFDGEYAQNISLLFDLKIFFLTILKVCRHDGVREGTFPAEEKRETVGAGKE